MADAPQRYWTPQAWLADGWRREVLLEVVDSHWSAVTSGVSSLPPGATVLAGPALPSLADTHSHAFQRAFVGLSERRESDQDDFWSWRDRMYRVALRVTPQQQRAIAARLYVELLLGGYTQACEFHYLHHAPDGSAYEDPITMSLSLADAAADAGIGLTLLPVLYERAGFQQPTLRDDQRRFAADAGTVIALRDAIRQANRNGVSAGVAIHSLRAASPSSIMKLVERLDGAPIHIHVAEQTGEVDDCLAATGLRPIEWLARHAPLDSRWQLVHATHATPAEIEAVARTGAGVVLCPSTEANLGDGITDLSGWLAAGVPLSIGSDSQATRDWREELRLAEYGQRLALRRRNVLAAPAEGAASTAERLWSRVLAGSAAAAGLARWGLTPGARADLLVIDPADWPGVPPAQLLDANVFSSPAPPWRDVMVAGRFVVSNHHHPAAASVRRSFESTVTELLRAS